MRTINLQNILVAMIDNDSLLLISKSGERTRLFNLSDIERDAVMHNVGRKLYIQVDYKLLSKQAA